MKEEAISWIFLATALATQKEPATLNEISMVADGINHSIPTQKELQNTFLWLQSNGYVIKSGKKYNLTTLGKRLYDEERGSSNELLVIWKNIKIRIKNIDATL